MSHQACQTIRRHQISSRKKIKDNKTRKHKIIGQIQLDRGREWKIIGQIQLDRGREWMYHPPPTPLGFFYRPM